jgi:hypothetical protein
LDSQSSFKTLRTYREAIIKFTKDDRVPVVVAATKGTLKVIVVKYPLADRPRAVQDYQIKDWCSMFSYPYLECSAKTGDNVFQVFELILKKIQSNVDKGFVQQPHKWKKTNFTTPTNCRFDPILHL